MMTNQTEQHSGHVGALNVECPKCRALPGIFCIENPRPDIMLVHSERVEKTSDDEASQ